MDRDQLVHFLELGATHDFANPADWPGEPCWNCGRLTTLLEINFQARLCSDECAEDKWDEFEAAVYQDAVEFLGNPGDTP